MVRAVQQSGKNGTASFMKFSRIKMAVTKHFYHLPASIQEYQSTLKRVITIDSDLYGKHVPI